MPVFLPSEIITRIIESAAFQDKIHDLQYTYAYWALPNLCLVSKRFYTLTAPLLYHDVIIRTGFAAFKLLPKLVPLLSQKQRLELRSYAPNGEDVFIDQERIVNPLWVRRLILLEAGCIQDPRRALLWRCIQIAVQDMENLQFVCWESKPRSPRLAQNLHQLPRLSHVVCRNTDYLLSPGSSLCPLKSLTVVYLSEYANAYSSPRSLYQILQTSAKSLKELHLCFNLPTSARKARIADACKQDKVPIQLAAVEDLLLTGYDDSVIETLTKVLDFSRLKLLQLVKYERKVCRLPLPSLKSLQKISVYLPPSSVVHLLNKCENLREIHVVCQNEDRTLKLLEAVLKHGGSLIALTLGNGGAFTAEAFAKLVSGCPKLEDLRVDTDFLEWNHIATELPKLLSLKHLCLNRAFHNSTSPDPTPFTISGRQVLTSHGNPWWDASDPRGPQSHFSELEKALGQLLEASVTHAASIHNKPTPLRWRDYSKLRSIKISAQGLDPRNRVELLTQAYLLREGAPLQEFPKPYTYSYRGIPWLAPVGQLYSYNTHGIAISIQIAEAHPRFARLKRGDKPGAVIGKWDSAFKAGSEWPGCRLRCEVCMY